MALLARMVVIPLFPKHGDEQKRWDMLYTQESLTYQGTSIETMLTTFGVRSAAAATLPD